VFLHSQGLALWGHALFLVVRSDASKEFAGGGIAGDKRGSGVAAFQDGRAGIETESSLSLLTMTTKAVLLEEGMDLTQELGVCLGCSCARGVDLGVEEVIDGVA
jgi:hypothetical protein